MQFVLMTEPQLGMTYDTILDLAQWAESAGLAGFSRSDHYTFGGFDGPHATDAFATLGPLLQSMPFMGRGRPMPGAPWKPSP